MNDQKKKRISKNTTRNLIASLDTGDGDDQTKIIQPEAEQVSEYNIHNDNGQYQSIAANAANKKRVSFGSKVTVFKRDSSAAAAAGCSYRRMPSPSPSPLPDEFFNNTNAFFNQFQSETETHLSGSAINMETVTISQKTNATMAAADVDVSDADYCMDDPDKDYTNQHYTPFRSTQIGATSILKDQTPTASGRTLLDDITYNNRDPLIDFDMEDEIGSMGNFGATTATGPHHSPAIAATTNKLLQPCFSDTTASGSHGGNGSQSQLQNPEIEMTESASAMASWKSMIDSIIDMEDENTSVTAFGTPTGPINFSPAPAIIETTNKSLQLQPGPDTTVTEVEVDDVTEASQQCTPIRQDITGLVEISNKSLSPIDQDQDPRLLMSTEEFERYWEAAMEKAEDDYADALTKYTEKLKLLYEHEHAQLRLVGKSVDRVNKWRQQHTQWEQTFKDGIVQMLAEVQNHVDR